MKVHQSATSDPFKPRMEASGPNGEVAQDCELAHAAVPLATAPQFAAGIQNQVLTGAGFAMMKPKKNARQPGHIPPELSSCVADYAERLWNRKQVWLRGVHSR